MKVTISWWRILLGITVGVVVLFPLIWGGLRGWDTSDLITLSIFGGLLLVVILDLRRR